MARHSERTLLQPIPDSSSADCGYAALLYRMADRRLTAAQQPDLAVRFADIEKTVVGPGEHEHCHGFLRELKDAYLWAPGLDTGPTGHI